MFNRFNDIGQFRNTIREVTDAAQFTGMVNGEPTFNKLAKMPTVMVEFTEKIHGTNACVGMDSSSNMFVQSRKNIITIDKDNAGCAKFVDEHKDEWKMILLDLGMRQPFDYIYVYFEFCGGNIQSNSAVTSLDKRAVIFSHFKVVLGETETWLSTRHIDAPYANIFNIKNFDTWKVEVDFNNPLLSQNAMVELVEKTIEPNSPLGRAMGVEGNIGEGMVGTFEFNNKVFKFKVKGDKHANSKVKKLKEVDQEFEQKKVDFANYATTSSRLEQALSELCGLDEDRIRPEIKMTGDFLRLVIADVRKEESDIMEEKGLVDKDVNASISKIARLWFMEQL